ncbi:MAG: alpha-glucan family phosphorylase [Candidatus Glassbacteria bacterium]|nr:alpha-glucan family phosphorylase [Candidatus Glassbacteria bacterium]
MKKITEFSVVPVLPEKLAVLRELACNLYWDWNYDIIDLFRRMDSELWESTRHNPVMMLATVSQETLNALAGDDGFLSQLEGVKSKLDEYLGDQKTWFRKNHGQDSGLQAAYFSAEFGITECLPIYSGGLGILAGDHLKSASDLGVPLVGMGLMYQHGYFRQYLNIDGYQQEAYIENDPFKMPVQLVKDNKNQPLIISVEFPGREVKARIWKTQVGRVPLYLLDTNIPENNPNDRQITYQLYGGDKEMRIQQEILIGIGGVRALDALGIEPSVFHMNEGHAAFLGLERIRRIMEKGKLSFDQARMAVRGGGVFTTHTPVPAGIDMFEPALIERYFAQYMEYFGLSKKGFLALGRRNPENDLEPFNMVYLAFRLSSCYNGVSRLHAQVSRSMWQGGWPGVPLDDIPITHITNGVHIHSWISHDVKALYDRYLGHRWRENPTDTSAWEKVEQIPVDELWNTHERRRERLVAFARRRLKRQLTDRGASHQEIEVADEVLDSQALTIGFARRFATYKRATLLLKDLDRFKKILTDKDRPVQIIFAGKAHPKDEEGKALIRQIVHFSTDPEVRRRVVFLENYDMIVSRYMVGGVDIWLNTPRRPMEASGTSGMKIVGNGGLNLSILDGWWCEGYEMDQNVGWAIGMGEDYEDLALQDEVEANALYNLLENEVVPSFYSRGEDGLPRRWVSKMKASISKLTPMFNTHRMVQEYLERFYLKADAHSRVMAEKGYQRSVALAAWRDKVKTEWKSVSIEKVEADITREYPVGTEMLVTATLRLGALEPGDVAVEVYYGPVNHRREITEAFTVAMEHKGVDQNGLHTFAGPVKCAQSGQHGYTVRVLPSHPDMVHPYELRVILWQ